MADKFIKYLEHLEKTHEVKFQKEMRQRKRNLVVVIGIELIVITAIWFVRRVG